MADAVDLKSTIRKGVWVRLPYPAPSYMKLFKVESTDSYLRFYYWNGYFQINRDIRAKEEKRSERAACKIIDLAQNLNEKHMIDMTNYLKALLETRQFRNAVKTK